MIGCRSFSSLYLSRLIIVTSNGGGHWGLRCCGVAVLLSFLCGIPVNKIPHCGVAVISNPTVCEVCDFKPTVFGETKLFAVSGRH